MSLWTPEDFPGEALAVRRHSDRCFHAAEEEVPEGYIVQGVLFPREEIAEVRRTSLDADASTCPPPRRSPPSPAQE